MNPFALEYENLKEEIDKSQIRVLSSGSYVLGQEVEAFEREFAEYLGVSQVIGVANGLDALQISLLASGVEPGDEVITTSMSAVATVLAITNIGAVPVFVDIDDHFHLDSSKIEEKIGSRTKAILPVHLYGQPVDVDVIRKIADNNSLVIIEDSAQAHGSLFRNKKAGSFGLASGFSFYPTKNLGSYGDAGAISTDDSNISDKCRLLRNYGQRTRYDHELKGINSRLDELQAAALRVKLHHLDEWNQRRADIAKIYSDELSSISKIQLPKIRPNSKHVFHQFVLQVDQRDEFQSYMKSKGVELNIHYPIPIHKQKCYEEFNNLVLANTERMVKTIISLPIHPYYSDEYVFKVVNNIKEFFDKL